MTRQGVCLKLGSYSCALSRVHARPTCLLSGWDVRGEGLPTLPALKWRFCSED